MLKGEYQIMLVKDFKKILNELPDDMSIIIPVIDGDKINHDFDYVRTSGFLMSQSAIRKMINNG